MMRIFCLYSNICILNDDDVGAWVIQCSRINIIVMTFNNACLQVASVVRMFTKVIVLLWFYNKTLFLVAGKDTLL